MLTFDELLKKEACERGFDRGFVRGLEMGELQGQRKILLYLLTRRFGTLPESVKTRVDSAGAGDLERWTERILDATSLDAVFAS